MSPEEEVRLRPSEFTELWRKILHSKRFSRDDLRNLIETETTGTSYYELRAYISKYRPESWNDEPETSGEGRERRETNGTPGNRMGKKTKARQGIRIEIQEELELLVENLTPHLQRKMELAWLRTIRRDGSLSVITGLKRECMNVNAHENSPKALFFLNLLAECAQRGFQYAVVWGNKVDEMNFRLVSDAVSNSLGPNLPLLFAFAASVVVPFFGSEFYNYLVYFAYKNRLFSQPTPVHSAIVALARPIFSQGRWNSGLLAILNASVDDTLGEALDAHGITRSTITELSKVRIQKDMDGDRPPCPHPDEDSGEFSAMPRQIIYQTNGWLPRCFHQPDIEKLTCNMLQRVGGEDFNYCKDSQRFSSTISQIYEEYIPSLSFVSEALRLATIAKGSHTLIIGVDLEELNAADLLRKAASRGDRGAQFSLLLRWPSEIFGHTYTQASRESRKFAGTFIPNKHIRPIWFDDFEELPRLLCKIVRD